MRRNTKIKKSIYLDEKLNEEVQRYAKIYQLPQARAIAFLLEAALREKIKPRVEDLKGNLMYI